MKRKSKHVADLAHIFLILFAKSISPNLIDHLQDPFQVLAIVENGPREELSGFEAGKLIPLGIKCEFGVKFFQFIGVVDIGNVESFSRDRRVTRHAGFHQAYSNLSYFVPFLYL